MSAFIFHRFPTGFQFDLSLGTAWIDSELASTKKLVTLGAGLDTRAWRLHLEEVFEVDFPEVIKAKAPRVEFPNPRRSINIFLFVL